MLLPAQIKALLLHESPAVRELAATFFRTRDDRDPELVNVVAEAVRHYGLTEAMRELGGLEFHPTTPEAWENWRWLWQRVGEESNGQQSPDAGYRHLHLARGLARAPTEWAREHEAAVRQALRIDHESWGVIAAREKWAQWTPERRWEHLQSYAAGWEEQDEFPDDWNSPYVEMLLETVAHSNVPTNAEIEARLNSYSESKGDWLEPLFVRLAGLRRIESMIPYLVDHLGADDDAMPTAAQRALIQIGTDAVVQRIEQQFRGEDWSWQLYAAGVLEGIGLPSAEETLLTLCEGIQDAGIDAALGSALLRIFSERGLSVVRRLVLDGYDVTLDSLEDSLPVVAQVLGVEFYRDHEWIAAVERCQQKRQASWQGFRERFREPQIGSTWCDDNSPIEWSESDLAEATSIPGGTFIRDTHKVGRNEPCPCGSGKKYKKCCGVAVQRNVSE